MEEEEGTLSNSAFCLHAGRPANIRLMRSRHYVVICTFGYVRYVKFDASTVKYAPHNIQNDCHQSLSRSFSVHQNSVSAGAPLRTPLGELTALPQTA